MRVRNYQTEYRRRIESGLSRGLSRSQARGHRLAGERALSQKSPRPIAEWQLQDALQSLRRDGSLDRAAKSIGVSKERLRRIAIEQKLIEQRHRRWQIADKLRREFSIFSEGKAVRVVLASQDEASRAGRYMAAVNHFLSTNKADVLAPFAAHGVTDDTGQFHPFEVDPNRLYRLASVRDHAFENIYHLIL